jgi:hypothetical protein
VRTFTVHAHSRAAWRDFLLTRRMHQHPSAAHSRSIGHQGFVVAVPPRTQRRSSAPSSCSLACPPLTTLSPLVLAH